jgi:hypothetical protein
MKQPVALAAVVLTLGSLQPLASAGPVDAKRSHGMYEARWATYRNGTFLLFKLTGALHVGSRVWNGVAQGIRPNDDPLALRLSGLSEDGSLTTRKCLDATDMNAGAGGAVRCVASIDGGPEKELVLELSIGQAGGFYAGYDFKGTYVGP